MSMKRREDGTTGAPRPTGHGAQNDTERQGYQVTPQKPHRSPFPEGGRRAGARPVFLDKSLADEEIYVCQVRTDESAGGRC
jgi:hypothetical protein